MEDQFLWGMIRELRWKSDHDYNRIKGLLSELEEETVQILKRFVSLKANELSKKYEDAWLGRDGGPGINVGDDSWGDLIYDVVGRGEEFYNSITADKLRDMANTDDYVESFCYCFL